MKDMPARRRVHILQCCEVFGTNDAAEVHDCITAETAEIN